MLLLGALLIFFSQKIVTQTVHSEGRVTSVAGVVVGVGVGIVVVVGVAVRKYETEGLRHYQGFV